MILGGDIDGGVCKEECDDLRGNVFFGLTLASRNTSWFQVVILVEAFVRAGVVISEEPHLLLWPNGPENHQMSFR